LTCIKVVRRPSWKIATVMKHWLQLVFCAITLLTVASGTANAHAATRHVQATGAATVLLASASQAIGDVEQHLPCKPGPDQTDHVKCLVGFSFAALPASAGHVARLAGTKGRHWPDAASLARGREISPPVHPPKLTTP
jgi:hypothetical protein